MFADIDTSKIRILVSDPLTPEGIDLLSNDGKFEVVDKPGLSESQLAEMIGDFDALVIRSGTTVTREILKNSGRLKIIGRAGVGLDNVDVAAATERGVIVMNAPAGNTISTAEHTISMMLALARMIPTADRTMKAGQWAKKSIKGVELYRKTLGILGLGKIGSEVASRMRAFGMKILGNDPFVTEAAAEKMGVEVAGIDEICRRADIITVHTPLNNETRGLINAERIGLMKPTVLLINCARGGIIDEEALIAALKEDRVGGAALDVFSQEPLPDDHALRGLPNVVLSPHLAASTTEAQEKVTRDIALQMIEALEGGTIRNAVNAPSVDSRELERMAPVLGLAERLGKFVSQFCPMPVECMKILYSGSPAEYPLAPMTSALIKGYLEPQVELSVNYVNALYLAKSRGIEVIESRSSDCDDYAGLITVDARSANGEHNSISGTLFHGRDPRLVVINDKHFDVKPEGNLIVIQNRDVPGIVGSVGVALGKANINIADMTWGRADSGRGSDAITVLNVDDEVTPEVIDELRALPNIISVQLITV